MKRVHAENWSLRERLVLASSVLRSGDQNWMSVSRAMRTMADGWGEPRAAEWYSQKQCAVQYEQLLNTLAGSAPPKRKKRSLDAAASLPASAAAAADTPQEIIVRKLTQERIEELKAQLVELRASYLREKREQEELLSGRLDSRLDEIEQINQFFLRICSLLRVKSSCFVLLQTPQPESKPTSPLLTSLLQMPSPAMMHRTPTISSLLISSPPVPSPAVTPPRPIAATTLSQLLESPTIAVPALQKSPSRNPATTAREQVLALENVKDDLIDVKIEDIPLVETDPSVVVTDVDPTEVIVAAENIHTEEVVGKENTSIVSNPAGDSVSAIDDTPDSDLIAETLSELADLDSRTVEMIVVGPNAQLAGGIKEELVEITSTDIDLATGEAVAAAASMKEIIEGAEVVVEGEAATGAVIEETVVDSTVIVDTIVDFGSSIVEETAVEEEVVEKMEEEEEKEAKLGEEEVVVAEEVGGGGEEDEQQEVVEDEVVVETGETFVKEEVINEVVEQEEGEEEKGTGGEVEEAVKEKEDEERTEEGQVVSVEETVVESAEPGLDPTEEATEIETKNTTDEEESQDTRKEEETKPVDETVEVKEVNEGAEKKEEEIAEAEETVEEAPKEDVEKVEEKGGEEEEEGEKKEEEEEFGETRADVSSAIAVAVNEMMSSSSTPSTPTSAVLPNILSIASDTVSTSRPETPSTEEDNEPVANLAKKISRRHGGLSGSSSLPNSPLSINAQEERAALHAWKKSIMLVYNRLATHKYASLFLKPITNEQARGYHSVIHRPMDLSTIKKNIELGNLRTTVEFQRDMMLMFENAIMYNNQNTLVYEMATQMQAECIQHIQLMVEAMGEGVPLRNESDDVDITKMTRGGRSGKAETSQPSTGDSSRKRKRSSLPDTAATGKKKKVQGDDEGKKN
ncbi:hypothetical protein LSTR_LSTR005685 [Laodelphax striatellus]|uniref:Bromo domain-containing protein n=1 Tax=Laodelphax striatellus TaxID=195883 RepID=A0A482X890_LAOST|nr:hypothetical protein LSTR_LSTR005685 [Laodelphax striatellus]